MEKIKEQLLTYDRMLSNIRTGFNMYNFLLKNGSMYIPKKPKEMKPIQRCINNSIEVMLSTGMSYVEGVIIVLGVPITHAWNFYADDNIAYDYTIRDYSDCQWFGVKLPYDFIMFCSELHSWKIGTGCLESFAMSERSIQREGFDILMENGDFNI